jgi:hypothetical protein
MSTLLCNWHNKGNLCFMDKKDQRIPVMMSAAEVAAIDTWRARQPGVPSRSEAIRRLVQAGLSQEQ